MLVAIGTREGRMQITLRGALDSAGAAIAREQLRAATDSAAPGEIWLDLSGVSMLDGAGIGALAFLYRRLTAARCRLQVTPPSGQPLRYLQDLGLGAVFGLSRRSAAPLPDYARAA